VAAGVTWVRAAAEPAAGSGTLETLAIRGGGAVKARRYVFTCGPWLPKLFPDVLEGRIVPTRQEVLYFGTPPGDARFSAPAHPAWIDFGAEIYGIPDIESRGFKVAIDRHGPLFDPDASDRVVRAETLAEVRGFLGRRFPALAEAPLVESRVCQYENSSNGDFLVDRHPQRDNVWLVGGGSGHGFKHGPSLGEHAAACVLGEAEPEPRFRLATKERAQKRSVH
jgi:glycine/D-amino acid oxidase-like deaminating enzyme